VKSVNLEKFFREISALTHFNFAETIGDPPITFPVNTMDPLKMDFA